MIVRMSKVEIVGPKHLLQEVISFLQDLGIFQIEPASVGFIERGYEEHIRSFLPDEKTLSERLFLEDLGRKIDELFSYIPREPVRKSYIEPRSIIDAIAKTLERHIAVSKELSGRKEGLQKERSEFDQLAFFLNTLASLLTQIPETPDLDFIGLTIREPEMAEKVREILARITDWKFELLTETAGDGALVGLITIEKGLSERVKESLSEEHIPELAFPSSFSGLSFPEKIAYVEKKRAAVSVEIEKIETELGRFSQRWMPIYLRVREWVEDRLSLLKATASVFETRMCFCINGWMPTKDMESLRERLIAAFRGEVVLEEKDIFEEDLERVPIALKNPSYFRPFELLVKLLPLPKYTSFDPTPFIGIFFPVFFGMILGDAGYGTLLAILSALMMKRLPERKNIRDAFTILLVSSLYSVFFGIVYGEFFGELGHMLFGLEPLYIERRSAAIPLLYFALTVGVVHMSLGLFLGFLSALKKKTKKEALFKLLNVLVIFSLIAMIASFFKILPWLLMGPIIIVLLILTPLLFFAGGLLAPLEIIKSIGNIISYARIMAIGLASVLLAFVANRLAGMTGDIVVGIIVGGLLHTINIILGVFSPAIQSLRLHYVEFFTKFLEHGGKRFEPLKKG